MTTASPRAELDGRTEPAEAAPDVTLVDGDGQVYSKDDAASVVVSITDRNLESGDLNPGVGRKAAAVWKVGKNSFDPAKWKLAVATSPQLTFALKASSKKNT